MTKHKQAAIATLQKQFEEAGINTTEWGTGKTKTLAHLQKEIESGETVLITDSEGRLLRKVMVGNADVYYRSPDGKEYRLREAKQVFTDGRERCRDLNSAVSEKMKPGENPKDAMIRGIEEELGIKGDIFLTDEGIDDETIMSPSYPGLHSRYICHRFSVVFDDDQFNPEGYVERQPDKSTYFIWKEVK